MNAPTPAFPWTDDYALGHATMDDTHREFVAYIDALLKVDDAGFQALLTEFAAHTQQHFDQEKKWMHESDFPPVHCHDGEHERVLETVRVVGEHVAQGNLELGRKLVAALAEWFPQHAASMDRVLAMWMLQSAEERGSADAACCTPAPDVATRS